MSKELRAFCDTVVIIVSVIFVALIISWATVYFTAQELSIFLAIAGVIVMFKLIYDLRLAQIEHDAAILDLQKNLENK